MLLWLAEALGESGLGRALRAEIDADLRALRCGVRAVLICLACAEGSPPPQPNAPWRPAGPPPGVRRQRGRGSCFRHVTRVTRWRGQTLRGHFEALRAVIDRIDDILPRVRARVVRCPQRALVMVRALAAPCVSLAGVAATVADSS